MQISYLDTTLRKHMLKLGLDAVVMPGAQRLPIGGIPEQGPITVMRHDVVDQCRSTLDADR
jgi:hypothetical protein